MQSFVLKSLRSKTTVTATSNLVHLCNISLVVSRLSEAMLQSTSTLRPPEVHVFYRKIELCMGDNNMHAACTHEQEMVDHVIPELQDKVAACYN